MDCRAGRPFPTEKTRPGHHHPPLYIIIVGTLCIDLDRFPGGLCTLQNESSRGALTLGVIGPWRRTYQPPDLSANRKIPGTFMRKPEKDIKMGAELILCRIVSAVRPVLLPWHLDPGPGPTPLSKDKLRVPPPAVILCGAAAYCLPRMQPSSRKTKNLVF